MGDDFPINSLSMTTQQLHQTAISVCHTSFIGAECSRNSPQICVDGDAPVNGF